MLGYGLWHQSFGWPWETCTGDDCQDSRWKKFGVMHGCASPSLFCSVFIWRGGFAPSLCCDGTVFASLFKVFCHSGLGTRTILANCLGNDMGKACLSVHMKLVELLWSSKCIRTQTTCCLGTSVILIANACQCSVIAAIIFAVSYLHTVYPEPPRLFEIGVWRCITYDYISLVFSQMSTPSHAGSSSPRNEARRIRETILSVMDAADMAVILDTGSSDGTQNIIKQATWQNSAFPTFLKPIFFADSFNLTHWRVRGSSLFLLHFTTNLSL